MTTDSATNSPKNVQLAPMTPAAFAAWQKHAISDYANEKIAAGTWAKTEGLKMAKAEYHRLLPQGLATADALLWTITDQGASVGTLWVQWQKNAHRFFIYDIQINANKRDQGLGQATLNALTTFARNHSVTRIGLHVFGANQRARHVYEKMGFVTVDLVMEKKL